MNGTEMFFVIFCQQYILLFFSIGDYLQHKKCFKGYLNIKCAKDAKQLIGVADLLKRWEEQRKMNEPISYGKEKKIIMNYYRLLFVRFLV
jgi:hypothetical protein